MPWKSHHRHMILAISFAYRPEERNHVLKAAHCFREVHKGFPTVEIDMVEHFLQLRCIPQGHDRIPKSLILNNQNVITSRFAVPEGRQPCSITQLLCSLIDVAVFLPSL